MRLQWWRWAAALCVAVLWCVSGRRVQAQVDPSGGWRTLKTKHFRVHFTPGLEEAARRAAVNAERAYTKLSAELVPPRGTIDLVLSDDVDYTNGQASPTPTSRIILYARPPIDEQSLRFYGDWNALVIQHELTHIFHLDRTRGWWSVAQDVFGRNPMFFPNLYTPAWLTEGLAVYYESRLTGFGRMAGTAHTTIADAAASDNDLPRLDQVSLSAPEWPNGQSAYAYGSLLFTYLSNTRGADKIPKFIEISSGQTIPYLLDRSSERAFGISFEEAWRQFRDSVMAVVAARPRDHILALRTLTPQGNTASFPRWRDTSSILYSADNEHELPGLYMVTLAGQQTRLDRRNETDPNTPVPGTSDVVYSQLDYITPYVLRSDIYRRHNGHDEQLTHGQRLSYADARADGEVVAVQTTPGSTHLVLAAPERPGSHHYTVRPLTAVSPDTEWAEPQWSPDGHRIATVHWARGGYSEIVVLDTTGAVMQVITRSRSVEASPSWSADGRMIFFTSDRRRRTEVYFAVLDSTGAAVRVELLGGAGAGVFQPALSPDGHMLAVSSYRGNGYHIAVTPFDSAAGEPVLADTTEPYTIAMPDVGRDSSPVHHYAMWHNLVPHYWTPITGTSDQGYFEVGFLTSAFDPVDRHSYDVQALYNVREPGEPDLSASYQYSGFTYPVIHFGAAMYWDHERIANDQGNTIGLLVQRTTALSLSASLLRPRLRTNAVLTVGGELEFRDYNSSPDSVLGLLAPVYASHPIYPSVFVSGSWTNAQYPDLGISAENGVSLTGTVQQEWQPGTGPSSGSSQYVVGVADLYQALNLPGYAHHVVALRVAGGWESENSASTFSAGGRNGQSLQIVPGVTIGDEPRDFGVRGYGPDDARGTEAWSSSLEYRLPLFLPGRGLRLLPLYLGRVSLTAFDDAGEAWCPASGGVLPPACSAADAERRLMSSVGAELDLDAALQYDLPYRFRVGVAVPTSNRDFYGEAPIGFYFTVGVSF